MSPLDEGIGETKVQWSTPLLLLHGGYADCRSWVVELNIGGSMAGPAINMANLAIRGSGAVNGVSKLHGQVSRRLFQVLFPRWPEAEVPVTHVTNGVHTPTWDSAEADRV